MKRPANQISEGELSRIAINMAAFQRIIEFPQEVECSYSTGIFTCRGPKGETSMKLKYPGISLAVQDSQVRLTASKSSKKEKRIIHTFRAHIRNLLQGVTSGFQSTLKICSGHFPMTVAVEDSYLIIKNFLGEKIPRKAHILPTTKVEIKGADIIISGISKEDVGNTASNFELATRITNRDRRIFMDGIWITSKPRSIR